MGKMNIIISDDTEERFRKAVSDSKGMRKGNISIAIEEAINLWIVQQKRNERNREKR
jgi:Ribbon-helix-helix domain